jgi:Transposase
MAIPLSVQLAQIGRYLKPLVLRDELAYKGDPHVSEILSSRRFIVAYKREDRMPTSSTCPKAYLGIDVAKLKLDVVLLLEQRHVHRLFANTAEGFDALHSWIQEQGTFELSICLESTGSYSDAIVRFLLEQNYIVSLLNPAVLVSYRKTKNLRRKTDKVDAYLLALYGKDEQPAHLR